MNSRKIIEKIAYGAIFTSIAVIIKIFISIETPIFRISFYDFPLIICSILLGPLYGGIAGLITDLNYIITNPRGMIVGINWFTAECIFLGFFPGLYFHIFKYNKWKLSIMLFITLAIALLFNTLGIIQYYEIGYALTSLPWRILRDMVKYIIYIYLVDKFLTNPQLYNFSIFGSFSKKHRLINNDLNAEKVDVTE